MSSSLSKPLSGRRILVCGKGGSGKSTIVALAAVALERRGYEVAVLDGDASNPEGLIRLMFGEGSECSPEPLIEFFGGVDVVTCPVDDPSPLTRVNDQMPVPDYRIDVSKELLPSYYMRRGNITLFQAGKIEEYGQGCDGPLEKVVRDFLIHGDAVNLVDIKAGVEHFGRKVPDRMDCVLTVVDCTFESVCIARRTAGFCREMGLEEFWLILNKIDTEASESELLRHLGDLRARSLGRVRTDPEVLAASLAGHSLGTGMALRDVEGIVTSLEQAVEGGHGEGSHPPVQATATF